jgi:hypothetical protein
MDESKNVVLGGWAEGWREATTGKNIYVKNSIKRY